MITTWTRAVDDVPVDLATLYAAEQRAMTRLARAIVGSNAEAEELVHDAFVKLAQRGLGDIDDPVAYLRTTVIHLSRGWIRRAVTARRLGAVDAPRPLGEPHLDETWEAVQRLPRKYREVLALRFYADLPEADIAAIVGAKHSTVRSLVHRGLAKLREELS